MDEPPGAIVSLRKNCESKGYFSDSKVALQKIHILLFFDDFIAHIFFYVLRPKMNFGWYLTFESTFSSWKPENFGFYMMAILTFGKVFTQSRGVFVDVFFCMWTFWRVTFESLQTQRWNQFFTLVCYISILKVAIFYQSLKMTKSWAPPSYADAAKSPSPFFTSKHDNLFTIQYISNLFIREAMITYYYGSPAFRQKEKKNRREGGEVMRNSAL